MTKEYVFETLKDILSHVKPHLDLSRVNFNSRLVSDLGIDSLSMLLLSLAVENKFQLQFAADTPPFDTVGDVCAHILAVKNDE